MNQNRYQVYPNRIGKERESKNRGALRVGYVEDNADMVKRELAGYFAAVTNERNGVVRFYIWTTTPAEALFPNVGLWIGPYTALSEEIVPDDVSAVNRKAI
jgi:hypothetical protein